MNALSPRKIFFIDAVGAFASALGHGFILPFFGDFIGIPISILQFLGGIAFLFFLYSTTLTLLLPENWRVYLKAIAIANLLFCLVTIGLMFIYRAEISVYGYLYFIIEIVIVVALVKQEFRLANS